MAYIEFRYTNPEWVTDIHFGDFQNIRYSKKVLVEVIEYLSVTYWIRLKTIDDTLVIYIENKK